MEVQATGQAAAGGFSPSAAPAIPRTFHFVWLGGEPPAEYTAYMFKWLELHPEWRIMLWEDEDGFQLINQALWDQAEDIAGPHYLQFRSDVLRYEALLKFGGVYVDFDMEPQRSIEPLITVPAFCGWEIEGKWANNALMGARAGHPWLKDLVDMLPANVGHTRSRRNVRPNVMSGPQFLTPVLQQQPPGSVRVYPQGYFYPYLWNELHRRGEQFPDAYAVHHWNNQRKLRGVS